MGVAGAIINDMGAIGPLVLFVGLPGAILAALWWVGLHLIKPTKPSV
jgi:hypothetical protein